MAERSKKLGPRVTVSVAPHDYKTLNSLADREEVSVSWVVRRAIQEYLNTHSGQALARSRKRAPSTQRVKKIASRGHTYA